MDDNIKKAVQDVSAPVGIPPNVHDETRLGSKRSQSISIIAAIVIIIAILAVIVAINQQHPTTSRVSTATSTIGNVVGVPKPVSNSTISNTITSPLFHIETLTTWHNELAFIKSIPNISTLTYNISTISPFVEGSCVSARAAHVYIQNKTIISEQYPNYSKFNVRIPVTQYVALGLIPSANMSAFATQYNANGGFCNTAYTNASKYSKTQRFNYTLSGNNVHVLVMTNITNKSLEALNFHHSGGLPASMNFYIATSLIGNAEIESASVGFSAYSSGLLGKTISNENITVAAYLNSTLHTNSS